MKRLSSIALFISWWLALPVLAPAHAFLDHADPRVGSSVNTSPPVVRIWFTEELEPAFSKIQVFDPRGQEIDKHDVKMDGAQMTVSIPVLAPGSYKVIWNAVAIDTHHTSGSFTFEVTSP